MPLPDILASAAAAVGLETPQVLVSWDFQDDEYWALPWSNMRLQRSYERFPEAYNEGTNLLNESYSTSPSTYKSDLSPDGSKYAYYSLYFEHSNLGDSGILGSANLKTFNLKRGVSKMLSFHQDLVDYGGSPTRYTFWMVCFDQEGTRKILKYDANSPVLDSLELGVFERDLDVSALLQTNEYVVGAGFTGTYGASSNALPLVTNQRVMVLDISGSDDEIETSDVLYEDDIKDNLTAGSSVDQGYGRLEGGNVQWQVLDLSNKMVHMWGIVTQTVDFSGISAADYIDGFECDNDNDDYLLSYYNHVIRIPDSVSTAEDDDISEMYLAPYPIAPGSLHWYTPGFGIDNIGFWEEETGLYYWAYQAGDWDAVDVYGRDWYDPEANTVGLYHLEEGVGAPDVLNAADLANNGANSGCVEEAAGVHGYVYTRGYTSVETNSYVDIVNIAGNLDPTQGTVEFYFKANTEGEWDGSGYLFAWVGNSANDYLYIYLSGGSLIARYHSTTIDVSASGAVPDKDVEWHHIAITWSAAGNLKLFFDSTQLDTQALASAFSNASQTSLEICGVSSGIGSTAKGVYDEVRLSDTERNVHTYDTFWYRAAMLHEWTGRDYTTTPFEFRDQLFDDFIPEAIRIRDTENVHWFPNTELPDGEVLHRGGDLTDGGQLRALMRMHGLFMDRFVDARDRVVVDQDIEECSYRHIDQLSRLIGYHDVRKVVDPYTLDELDMTRLRQITKGMVEVWKRKGTLNSMHLFAKLYHIILDLEVFYYRRFWDSVIDPLRESVYLDSSVMDTSVAGEPIGEIRVRAYLRDYPIDTGTDGETGPDTTNTFLSSSATWNTNEKVNLGDLLLIEEPDSGGNEVANGAYLITNIVSDTKIVVDHLWDATTGGLTGLNFRVLKLLPDADPVSQFILAVLGYQSVYNIPSV